MSMNCVMFYSVGVLKLKNEPIVNEMDDWLEKYLSEDVKKEQTMDEWLEELLKEYDNPIDNYIDEMNEKNKWIEDFDELVQERKSDGTYFKPETLDELKTWVNDIFPDDKVEQDEKYEYIKERENLVLSNWYCETD